MEVAVRPHNDVRKLFITFSITFLAVHQIISSKMATSNKEVSSTTTLSSSTVANNNANAISCVESYVNNFYCPNNAQQGKEKQQEEEKPARKKVPYYLQNFGVKQTLEGNAEEHAKMITVVSEMEEYLKEWIEKYDHIELLKQQCINKHDKCVFWASIEECVKNPGYMENDCMLACKQCEKLLGTPPAINEF